MAHFYAQVQGNRGPSSRCGSRNSGITTDIRGWDIGCYVEIRHENGRDIVRVYATPGSNDENGERQLITEFTRREETT